MTYQEMMDRIFALPPRSREAAAEELLKQYTDDDKELVETYIYEAIVADDQSAQVFLI